MAVYNVSCKFLFQGSNIEGNVSFCRSCFDSTVQPVADGRCHKKSSIRVAGISRQHEGSNLLEWVFNSCQKPTLNLQSNDTSNFDLIRGILEDRFSFEYYIPSHDLRNKICRRGTFVGKDTCM